MADVIKINDNTYRVEDNGVRFFLLEGTEKAALIDTGRNVPEAREIAEGLTSLPLLLINTHADPDHISGNAAFEETYMSRAEERYYRTKGGTNRVIPVCDGDRIELGKRTLRIIDNPGHTPGSITILDEQNRVLVGGDSIQSGNIYMFGAHRNLAEYIKSLKRIDAMKDSFDTVYPSHGDFPVSPDIIEKLIDGAEKIQRGEAEAQSVNVHGTECLLYKFDYAGFFGEK